ncbi:MAG: hypothetical protein H0W74_12635 [Sphingosinicella sp.]|nr:hypothetical protein [Sphingosinicella sp.]
MNKANFSAALAATLAFAAPPAAAATIAEAQAAYGIYDVNQAEKLYRLVAENPEASAIDRGTANRELARIAWLVDGKREAALALLENSFAADPDLCPAAFLYGRILNDGPTGEVSVAKLAPFTDRCRETESGVALEAVRALTLAAAASASPDRAATAASARAAWERLPDIAKGAAGGTRLQLAIGLLTQDRSMALAGWRSYFWLTGTQSAPQALAQSGAEIATAFERGLSGSANARDATPLAALLLRAGFYDEFRQYVQDRALGRSGLAEWKRFEIYVRFRDNLLADILAHDRAYARAGAVDEEGYEKKLTNHLTDAAVALGGNKDDPIGALRTAYGIWGTMPGKSNGVSGVHLGHVVIDQVENVVQDGRNGTIRSLALDNMLHNSFSSWLMDGQSATGGWAADGATIVQVRPRYLHSIDDLALVAIGGPAKARALQEIERQRVTDREIASATPISYLPGVRSRLRLQGIEQLAKDVRSALKPGDSFELNFRKGYWDALIGSSIIAHEGRHVLDQAEFKASPLSGEELEYRAKLSEIRFAPQPRLALSSIYSPLIGGESGHGIANKRLATEFAAWIEGNVCEIKGYDPSLTALEQLDKLSDDQLVSIAAGLDGAVRTGKPVIEGRCPSPV